MPSIGITGGIATGKSSLTKYLLQRLPGRASMPIDVRMNCSASDVGVRSRVQAQFGAQSYGEDGSPNRGYLRDAVFSDSERRKELEAILHPVIRARWMALASEARARKDWFFADIPLLFESGVESCFDRVAVVACSPHTQISRLTGDRGLTHDLAERIIATQIDIQTKMSKADHLIWNDSSLSSLEQQVALLGDCLLSIP